MQNVITFISILILNVALAQVSDFKSIDFTVADNIANLKKGRSLDNFPLLAHELTYKLNTDVEKFRAIYTWVCTNIKGDLSVGDKVLHKRKKHKNDSLSYAQWNNYYLKKVFKKLFTHKKTMCTGYAYLIKQLCFFANIECEIINGYGRSFDNNVESLELINHSWNAVKLNNKWYLCDATWSSGYFLSTIFIEDYNLGYFLTEPTLFAKNHIPKDKKWFLNETLINSEYSTAPVVYGETFKHKTLPVSPQNMHVELKKGELLNFSFKTLESIDIIKVSLLQFVGINPVDFEINNLKEDNGMVSFSTTFKHKGFYDVHLAIGDDVVATYTVKVTK